MLHGGRIHIPLLPCRKMSGINVGESVGINERQVRMLQFIAQRRGAKIKDMQPVFKVVERTLERDAQVLREKNLIVLRGSRKAGKYQLTEKGEQLLS